MAGQTPAKAVQNFLDPLQKAVSCVTKTVINVSGGYYVARKPHILTLGDGAPVKLSTKTGLALSMTQRYKIVRATGERGPWKVSTLGYLYALEDSSGEIICYHWHPGTKLHANFPHIHLPAATQIGRDELVKGHLPSGRIAIEDVLRFAITELGAKPRHKDWTRVLDSTQKAFEDWRTWPQPKRGS